MEIVDERDAVHGNAVERNLMEKLSGLGAPHAHEAVGGTSGDPCPSRAERC
jgi:hypothetical protein